VASNTRASCTCQTNEHAAKFLKYFREALANPSLFVGGVLKWLVAKEALVAFYTLEATSGGGLVQMKSPLTASQAYARTVELRRQGFTNIVAINTTTGRRITEVKRLLIDL
jgi:hypothetical protein